MAMVMPMPPRFSALLVVLAGRALLASGLALRGESRGRQQLSLAAARSSSRQPASPLEWAEHGADWNDGECPNRDKASPINFDDFEDPLMLQKTFKYNWVPIEEPLELVNDGITISLDVSHLKEGDVGGVEYDNGYHRLTRIEFHSGSEHTFKGQHMPIEIQLTHAKKNAKSRVIVSVLVDAEGPMKEEESTFLQTRKRNVTLLETRKRKRRSSRRQGDDPMPGYEGLETNDLGNPDHREAEDVVHTIIDDPMAQEYADEALGKPRDGYEERQEDDQEISEIGSWEKASDDEPAEPVSSGPAARRTLAAAPVIRRADAGPAGLLGAARAPAPAAAPAAADVYKPPDMAKPDANPFLQNFLSETLPELDAVRKLDFSAGLPLKLNDLIGTVGKDSTFFEYLGTFTTPPCGGATWLVRRTPIRASTEQAKLFFKTLHTMTDDNGNYRTTMPRNGREIYVRQAVHTATIPTVNTADAQKEDEKRKFVAKMVGEDAKTISDAAVNYAKGLDEKLRRAAVAHVLALEPTAPPPAPPPEPAPGLPMAPQWQEPDYVRRAIASSGGSHADAVIKAIAASAAESTKQASLEAANLTAQAIYNNQEGKVRSAAGLPVAPAGAETFGEAPAPAPGGRMPGARSTSGSLQNVEEAEKLSDEAEELAAAAPVAGPTQPPWLAPPEPGMPTPPTLRRPPGSWSQDVMDATSYTFL